MPRPTRRRVMDGNSCAPPVPAATHLCVVPRRRSNHPPFPLLQWQTFQGVAGSTFLEAARELELLVLQVHLAATQLRKPIRFRHLQGRRGVRLRVTEDRQCIGRGTARCLRFEDATANPLHRPGHVLEGHREDFAHRVTLQKICGDAHHSAPDRRHVVQHLGLKSDTPCLLHLKQNSGRTVASRDFFFALLIS